jgi:vitamin B12 transporter
MRRFVLVTAALTLGLPVPGAGQITLDTIPVLGSRASDDLPLRTRSVQVFTRDEIRALPARNLADVLSWATGVELATRSPAQSDLSIRGAGFEQVLVLVDGVRMSDPQTGHFDLDLAVPLDRVERIEILRGAASAMYGSDAVGGVVNVVTRRDTGWSGRIEGGSFGTRSGSVHGGVLITPDIALEISGELGRSDGHRDETDWNQRLGTVTLRTPLAGGRLVMEGGRARRAFGAGDFYAPFPSFETTHTSTARLAWRGVSDGGFRIEPGISWRSHDDDFILIREDPGVYRNEHTSAQLAGEVVVRSPVWSGFSGATGVEAARHTLESNALGDRGENRAAFFGELAGTVAPGVELTTGIRHDRHEQWGGFTSPSLAVSAVLPGSLRVRGSAARSFRGPTFTERHYEDPAHQASPELAPERSTSHEVGVDLTPAGSWHFSVTGFRRSSRNLIDWARTPGGESDLWETRNVNRARFRGLELEAGWTLDALTRLSVGAFALSVDSDAEPGLESKYALRPVTEQVQLGIDRRLPLEARAHLRGTRARSASESSHVSLDLRLDLPIAGGKVYLDGRNLTDSDHPDLTGHPVPGRAFYLGFVRSAR